MEFKLPSEVLTVLNKFKEANFQIFIVGGSVRDLLLGREVKDWDFTTDAKPEEILKLFPEGFYDNKFGTVGIPIKKGRANPIQIFEVTTMRKEGDYKDHRHPTEVTWTNKIEEDLGRRDFTINAMAFGLPELLRSTQKVKRSDNQMSKLSPSEINRNSDYPSSSESFRIIDPFNGQTDLSKKIIQTVGDPSKRFTEDALRLMRAIRISTQLEFDIDQKTFSAIKENAELIKDIAWERIRDELFKILASVNPYIGIIKLREAGILQIILPELEACFGIVQEGPKHDRIYEIGDHSFRTMRETPSFDPLVKFAGLLHDVGKAITYKKDSKGNVTFYNHDIVGAEIALGIAKRFNLSKKQSDKLYKLIRWHMFSTNENQTDSAIRRFIKNVELENIEDMMAIRIGDRLGGDTSKPVSWRMEKFKEKIKRVLKKPFSITDLKVNGEDVMRELKIKPSRKVGEVLQKLFEEVEKDSSKNTREYLLDRIKHLN